MIIIQNQLLLTSFRIIWGAKGCVFGSFSGIYGESKKITADVLQKTGPKSIVIEINNVTSEKGPQTRCPQKMYNRTCLKVFLRKIKNLMVAYTKLFVKNFQLIIEIFPPTVHMAKNWKSMSEIGLRHPLLYLLGADVPLLLWLNALGFFFSIGQGLQGRTAGASR